MNSNYHFLIIVEFVTSKVLLQHHELHSSFVFRNGMVCLFLIACQGLIGNAKELANLMTRCDMCVIVLGDYADIQWHLVEDIIYINSVMTFI
jgi:hypothetical protein